MIVGGAFLLTPGFISDIVGLLLLIPPTRAVIAARHHPLAAAPRPAAVGHSGRAAGRRVVPRAGGPRHPARMPSRCEPESPPELEPPRP